MGVSASVRAEKNVPHAWSSRKGATTYRAVQQIYGEVLARLSFPGAAVALSQTHFSVLKLCATPCLYPTRCYAAAFERGPRVTKELVLNVRREGRVGQRRRVAQTNRVSDGLLQEIS